MELSPKRYLDKSVMTDKCEDFDPRGSPGGCNREAVEECATIETQRVEKSLKVEPMEPSPVSTDAEAAKRHASNMDDENSQRGDNEKCDRLARVRQHPLFRDLQETLAVDCRYSQIPYSLLYLLTPVEEKTDITSKRSNKRSGVETSRRESSQVESPDRSDCESRLVRRGTTWCQVPSTEHDQYETISSTIVEKHTQLSELFVRVRAHQTPDTLALERMYASATEQLERARYAALAFNCLSDACKLVINTYYDHERALLVDRVLRSMTLFEERAAAGRSRGVYVGMELAESGENRGRKERRRQEHEMRMDHDGQGDVAESMCSSGGSYCRDGCSPGGSVRSDADHAPDSPLDLSSKGSSSVMPGHRLARPTSTASSSSSCSSSRPGPSSRRTMSRNTEGASTGLPRRTRFLQKHSITVLQTWYDRNKVHPYPSDAQVEWLAQAAEILPGQVKKWMANTRTRSCNTLAHNGCKYMLVTKSAVKKRMLSKYTQETTQHAGPTTASAKTDYYNIGDRTPPPGRDTESLPANTAITCKTECIDESMDSVWRGNTSQGEPLLQQAPPPGYNQTGSRSLDEVIERCLNFQKTSQPKQRPGKQCDNSSSSRREWYAEAGAASTSSRHGYERREEEGDVRRCGSREYLQYGEEEPMGEGNSGMSARLVGKSSLDSLKDVVSSVTSSVAPREAHVGTADPLYHSGECAQSPESSLEYCSDDDFDSSEEATMAEFSAGGGPSMVISPGGSRGEIGASSSSSVTARGHESSSSWTVTSKRYLSSDARRILNDWFMTHIKRPYPTQEEKCELALKCSISTAKVDTWFANKRNRTHNTRKLLPKYSHRLLKPQTA